MATVCLHSASPMATVCVHGASAAALKALLQGSPATTLDSLPSMGTDSEESELTEGQRKRVLEASHKHAEMEMRLNTVRLRSMEMAVHVRADRETNRRLEAQNADLQALLGQLLAGQRPTLSQQQQSLIFGPRPLPAAPEPQELPLPRFATPSGDAEHVLEQVLREYDTRVASMAAQKEESFPKCWP